jgi:hypothetical protein
MTQFFGNIRYHQGASMFSDPLGAIAEEVRLRYLRYFGLGDRMTHPVKQLRGIQLLAYAASFVLLLTVRRFRIVPGVRVIAAVTAIVVITLAVVDGGRAGTYIVHILPWLSALLALAAHGLIRDGRGRATAVAGTLLFLVSLQIAGVMFVARQRTLQTQFYPATEFLLARVPPDATIFGSGDLGFAIGFDRRLIDDVSLGLRSGKRADFIVLDENWRSGYGIHDGKIGTGHVARVLETCTLVFRNDGYQIFRCASDGQANVRHRPDLRDLPR